MTKHDDDQERRGARRKWAGARGIEAVPRAHRRPGAAGDDLAFVLVLRRSPGTARRHRAARGEKSLLHSSRDASWLTALFRGLRSVRGHRRPICSLVTPCQAGASPVSVQRGVSPRGGSPCRGGASAGNRTLNSTSRVAASRLTTSARALSTSTPLGPRRRVPGTTAGPAEPRRLLFVCANAATIRTPAIAQRRDELCTHDRSRSSCRTPRRLPACRKKRSVSRASSPILGPAATLH